VAWQGFVKVPDRTPACFVFVDPATSATPKTRHPEHSKECAYWLAGRADFAIVPLQAGIAPRQILSLVPRETPPRFNMFSVFTNASNSC
jgi:hypothetical protein